MGCQQLSQRLISSMLFVLLLVGCTVPPLASPTVPTPELDTSEVASGDIVVIKQALLGGVHFSDCTAEVQNLTKALDVLVQTMTDDTDFNNFSQCMARAPLVENNGQTAASIPYLLRSSQIVAIRCYNGPTDPNNESVVLAEAPVDTEEERLRISRGFVVTSDPRTIAAVIAHELMHNKGFQHKRNDFGSPFYGLTVPEQVRACIVNISPNPCPLPNGCSCQQLSDQYCIAANTTWGVAPPNVQDIWIGYSCNATPLLGCQELSDRYDIYAGQTWGTAPQFIRDIWVANRCSTAPRNIDCQVLSDAYQIYAGVTFGTAPEYIQELWKIFQCTQKPKGTDCQSLSDAYNIYAGITFGTAPSHIQDIWKAQNCATSPKVQPRCQSLSDTFDIHQGITFGFAPNYVQDIWKAQNCATSPKVQPVPPSCQSLSDRYDIYAGITFGTAPIDIQDIWKSLNCATQPRAQPSCQSLSDKYGIYHGFTFGNAPGYIRDIWKSRGCTTNPSRAACGR